MEYIYIYLWSNEETVPFSSIRNPGARFRGSDETGWSQLPQGYIGASGRCTVATLPMLRVIVGSRAVRGAVEGPRGIERERNRGEEEEEGEGRKKGRAVYTAWRGEGEENDGGLSSGLFSK